MSIQIHTVPNSHAIDWFKFCWEVTKKNYRTALGASLLIAAISLIGSFTPLVGPVASAFLGILFQASYVHFGHGFITENPRKVGEIFYGLQNTALFKRLTPLLALMCGLQFATIFISGVGEAIGVPELLTIPIIGLIGIFSFIINVATIFVVPILYFHDVDFMTALRHSVEALMQNIVPLILGFFTFVALALVCAMCFLIPIILVLLPMMTSVSYIIYMTIFEGQPLENRGQLNTVPETPPTD